MPELIINADDFGLTDGVTRGIVEAILQGVVTSTTAMVCVPGAAERLRRWAPQIPPCIGAHLQLTTGRPLSDPSLIPTLCGVDGNFHKNKNSLISASTHEILVEWQAQYNFLLSLGIKPTHIDTHHHVHKLPNVFEAFCEMAKWLQLPARAATVAMRNALHHAGVPCADQMNLSFYGDALDREMFVTLATTLSDSMLTDTVVEIMCHPGYACTGLPALSKYTHQREQELQILCAPQVRQHLDRLGVLLSSYRTLRSRPSPKVSAA